MKRMSPIDTWLSVHRSHVLAYAGMGCYAVHEVGLCSVAKSVDPVFFNVHTNCERCKSLTLAIVGAWERRYGERPAIMVQASMDFHVASAIQSDPDPQSGHPTGHPPAPTTDLEN